MQIKDGVHGYISLTEEETRILDSPALQRMRRIRQLGLTSLVYPSATHTRFQHSLGVMYMAGEFADSLGLDEQEKKELRIAGLLHDTGHGPFSHVSEIMVKKFGLSHEDFSCEVIDRLEDRYTVDADKIHRIIRGESRFGGIVAGDVDADRIDYLMRDAHNTGVKYGEIDAETIVRLADIRDGSVVFDVKAVPNLEALLTARFHMIKTVYGHPTTQIAEKMLQRALESYHSQGYGVEEIMRMDDYEAHNCLMESKGESKALYKRIKNRKLFKQALSWDKEEISKKSMVSIDKKIDDPKQIERKIAEKAGIKPRDVILDTPNIPEIEDLDIQVVKDGEVGSLSEHSDLPESLGKAEWRNVSVNVYCPKENRKEVRKASKEVLKSYTHILDKFL